MVIFHFHYFVMYEQCTSTIESETDPRHDATTIVLDSLYGVLRFKSVTMILSKHNLIYGDQKAETCLNIPQKTFSYFKCTLSVHGNVNLCSCERKHWCSHSFGLITT